MNQHGVYCPTQKVTPAYTIQVLPNADGQQQSQRFNALMTQLGQPDRKATNDFLELRDEDSPDEAETADLIAKVKEKIAHRQPVETG